MTLVGVAIMYFYKVLNYKKETQGKVFACVP